MLYRSLTGTWHGEESSCANVIGAPCVSCKVKSGAFLSNLRGAGWRRKMGTHKPEDERMKRKEDDRMLNVHPAALLATAVPLAAGFA